MTRNKFLIPILIAAVGLLAYSNTFRVPFQFDDDAYVVNNPFIRTFHYFAAPSDIASLTEQSPLLVPVALRYAFLTRIIGYLSLAVNYHLHGLDVAGYHIVNLLIHILNGFLVYFILAATLNAVTFPRMGNGPTYAPGEITAVAVSLLFVSHPIQTQAVTYIASRFVLLATFFFLLALYSYIRFRASLPGSRRRMWFLSAIISTVAAMLSKEFTATLPIVIALYEVFFFSGSSKERVKALAFFAATLLIIPAFVFLKQGTVSTLDSTMRTITAADVTNISRANYFFTQFRVIALYLRLLFLPVGQNVDHDIPVYTSLFDMPVLLSFLLLIAFFSAGVYLFVRSAKEKEYPGLRLASFGIFWFFITMSVESSIIPLGELVAEYRVYLPSVGIITAGVSLAIYAAQRIRKRQSLPTAIYALVGGLVFILSVGTYIRNAVWTSEISLWEDAASKSPMKLRPHQNLGTDYMAKGRLEDAERELLAALRLAPNDFEVHNNLGILYKTKGDYNRAIGEFLMASRLSPSDPMAHYNLGNLYLTEGRVADAIREYETALETIPDYDEAHNNLGIAYTKSGRCDAAIAEFRKALSLNPQNEKARQNMQACIGKR